MQNVLFRRYFLASFGAARRPEGTGRTQQMTVEVVHADIANEGQTTPASHGQTESDRDGQVCRIVEVVRTRAQLLRMTTRVLFVCLGNICRSPAAEGVFQRLLDEAGLSDAFTVDSAGTGAWHEGELPDRRMRRAAAQRGIALTSIARQVTERDFDHFDHVLAMDGANLRDLRAMAPSAHHGKIRLFRDLDPDGRGADVPDPYYGGPAGFDEVLDIVTRTGRAWLAELAPGRS